MRQSAASLTQAAYESMRADLLACRLKPGERLKINDLCGQFSAGLSAVREALARLTAEGLVVAEPQRGFRVAPISARELRDLTAVRIEIEGLCLKRALAIGDIAWESQVVAAFHRLAHAPERMPGDSQRIHDEWAAVHADFHEAVVAACDSPWLMRLRALLYAQSERYRRLSVPMARTHRDLHGEHHRLMQAVLARDADLALQVMAEHLAVTTQILLAGPWVENDDPPAAPPAYARPVLGRA